MAGAGLEHTVERILQKPWCAAWRAVAQLPAGRRKSGKARIMSEIVLVLAVAENGVIGKDGGIPWHISDDLKRFKALTMGGTVVMGRKTWASLPKTRLPGRRNIVVPRDAKWRADGAETMGLEEALALPDLFVIGGAEIYRAALGRADRIELTEVHKAFD